MHLSVGLSVSESAKLCSYMHFRDAICLQEKSLLQKANLDKAIDFMDTLEEDIPKGQSKRMNRNSQKLKIRHLAIFFNFKSTTAIKLFSQNYCLKVEEKK